MSTPSLLDNDDGPDESRCCRFVFWLTQYKGLLTAKNDDESPMSEHGSLPVAYVVSWT